MGFAVIALYVIYLANVEIQTHLGEKALSATGLQSTQLAQALADSKTLKKPVLVEMSAIWCPTCRKLDKKVFADPGVGAFIKKNFIFSRLEYETKEAEEFRSIHQLSGFPVLMVLDGTDDSAIELPLTFSAEEFQAKLEQVLLKKG